MLVAYFWEGMWSQIKAVAVGMENGNRNLCQMEDMGCRKGGGRYLGGLGLSGGGDGGSRQRSSFPGCRQAWCQALLDLRLTALLTWRCSVGSWLGGSGANERELDWSLRWLRPEVLTKVVRRLARR